MSKLLRVTVVRNVRFSSCKNIVDVVRCCRDDVYVVCGGVWECLDLIEAVDKGYGIVSAQDDEHVVKVLKQRGMFVCGRWNKTAGLCVAGIDGKNPTQALSRILAEVPSGCDILIVVSAYTIASSRCSRVIVSGKEVYIGLPRIYSEALISMSSSAPLVVLACPDHGEGLCLDRLHAKALLISVPKDVQIARFEIDLQNLEVSPLGLECCRASQALATQI